MERIPDFYELDESWYRYMRAGHNKRKEMCDDCIDVISIVYGLGIIGLVCGAIWALCHGWV